MSEVKAEATIEVPSSKDSHAAPQETQNQQAAEVIQAAIQTGAAAERTETAAAEAQAAAMTVEQHLASLRKLLEPELVAINERLKHLEELEAEETEEIEEAITQAEGGDTPTIVSAEIVKLEEPQGKRDTAETTQQGSPETKRGRSVFHKLFLNL